MTNLQSTLRSDADVAQWRRELFDAAVAAQLDARSRLRLLVVADRMTRELLAAHGQIRLETTFDEQSVRVTTSASHEPSAELASLATFDRSEDALTATVAVSRSNGGAQDSTEFDDVVALLRRLDDCESDLERLGGELEDTNRGVLALYAELDDRASRLREANEVKSRFLSYMSHEFRTPLSSILALTRILLARIDGDLTADQEKQVELIQGAATDLASTVNDLLDLSKIEAGHIDVRPSNVSVSELFSALRGMFRPLVLDGDVALHFEHDPDLTLYTDETRLSQILRNFISNAIKFTTKGEIRVAAMASGEDVRFEVRDTGIGIAPENMEKIFEEFSQLDSPLQRRVTGTGLGLPLCRKLAQLLGGTVGVESRSGVGSTFFVLLPRRLSG